MRGYIILILLGILAAGCTQPEVQENDTLDGVTTEPIQECIGPVCGVDGKTYGSDCEAELVEVEIDYMGECLVLDTCTDSDGGMEVAISGTVEMGDDVYDDYCENNTLNEYNCVDNAVVTIPFECAEDQECLDGACVDLEDEPEENETIEEPESGCVGPYEANVSIKENVTYNGTVYADECIEFQVVKDYICNEDVMETINNECDPGYGCDDGVCVYQPYMCSETDGGNDTLVRGTTVVSRGLSMSFNQNDECVDEAILKEHFCYLNGTAGTQEIQCASGLKCVSGRCIKSKCSETDDGFDLYNAGVTSVYDIEEEDDCISDEELQEFYCYGDEIREKIVQCGDGYYCSNHNNKCMEGSMGD